MKTTLGRGLFQDPLTGAHRIGDIRYWLELKLAACVAMDGTNGYPIEPRRIKNDSFRSLVAYGMILKNWTVKDLLGCAHRLEGAAATVLQATLEKPIWGQGDYLLFEALERIEGLQFEALTGGNTL